MTQIHTQIGYRLAVLILQRAERLKNVELRNRAVNAGDAVAQIGRQSFCGNKPDRGHSEMSVVGVVRIGEQRIGRVIRCTRTGTAYEWKANPNWRRVIEADQCILDHIVVVVCPKRSRGVSEAVIP